MPRPPNSRRYQLLICDGPSCGSVHDSEALAVSAGAVVEADEGLRARVTVCAYTCFGRCDDGPNAFVRELEVDEDPKEEPDVDVLDTQRGFYPGMDAVKLAQVLQEHCGRGQVCEALVDEY